MSDITNEETNQEPIDLGIIPTETEPTPTSAPEPTPNAEGGVQTPSTAPTIEPTEPAQVTQPTAVPTASPVYVDAKQLAAEMVAQQQAVNAEPSLTQEEIDKILRTVKVNESDVETFFNADTSLEQKTKLFQNLLVSAVENAVARNQVLMQSAMDNFYNNEFRPIAQQISVESARAYNEAFYKEYPGLVDYQDAVALVARAAMNDPAYKNLSNQETSAKVAESVTSLLKKTFPNFDPKVKLSGQAQPSVSVPKATTPSFQTGTKVVSNPAAGQYPSSSPADSDIFGDEGLN